MGITKLVEDLGPHRFVPNTKVSTNHGYSNACKHTSIHSFLSGMCWNRSYAGQFSLWPLGCAITTGGEMRPDGDKGRRKERKWRKTGANKQNKLSKALCWAGAGTEVCACVYMCVCEAMWTEWRGLGQILGCPTHSWLMIQSWSTAQRTSRHGTLGCVPASVCVCVSESVCTGMWARLMCISVQAFAKMQLYKQLCVCI